MEATNIKEAEERALDAYDPDESTNETIERDAFLISPPVCDKVKDAIVEVLGYLNDDVREYEQRKEDGEDVSEHIGKALSLLSAFVKEGS